MELFANKEYLIHTSLFVFLLANNPAFLDFCFSQSYIHTLQTSSPYLIRYLTFFLVIHYRERKHQIRELVRIIEMVTYLIKIGKTEL